MCFHEFFQQNHLPHIPNFSRDIKVIKRKTGQTSQIQFLRILFPQFFCEFLTHQIALATLFSAKAPVKLTTFFLSNRISMKYTWKLTSELAKQEKLRNINW